MTERPYRVVISKQASKDLARLDRVARRRVDEVIGGLCTNPRPRGCKKLRGRDAWRVRVGDIRIIYALRDSELVVFVVKIGDRKEVYR